MKEEGATPDNGGIPIIEIQEDEIIPDKGVYLNLEVNN